MSEDWIEESALRFEGFTDEEIAKIKLAIPQIESLLAIYQKNQSDVNRAKALVDQILPTAIMVLNRLKERTA
jgi:hypothetical protein